MSIHAASTPCIPCLLRLGPRLLARVLAGSLALPALANPTGPVVVNGAAAFSSANGRLSVINTPGAVINWNSFSIAPNEATRFIQKNAASQVLNRVVGQDPSQIFGSLSSNGRVFLINQNGIAFGPNSQVNVAGLAASTLELSNADFLAGKLNFAALPRSGHVVSRGAIRTGKGGEVYLLGATVENSGIITAPDGTVILAAGKAISIIDWNNPEIALSLGAPEHKAINVGRILAGNVGVLAGAIMNAGEIGANRAVTGDGGRIFLLAAGDVDLQAGSLIHADGARSGRAGEWTNLRHWPHWPHWSHWSHWSQWPQWGRDRAGSFAPDSLRLRPVANTGMRDILAGAITMKGSVLSQGTIRTGSLVLTSGTLRVKPGSVVDVAGTADIGVGSALDLDAGLLNAGRLSIHGLAALNGGTLSANDVAVGSGGALRFNGGMATVKGTLGVEGGAAFSHSAAGPMTVYGLTSNAGNFRVQADGLNLRGGYLQTDGQTTLGSGPAAPASLLAGAAGLQLDGGMLTGSGVVVGDLHVGTATIAPGYGAGRLTVAGNLDLAPSSIMRISIGGLAAEADFPLIDVTGAAHLAGALDVELPGGYAPPPGSAYRFLSHAASTGGFDAIIAPPSTKPALESAGRYQQLAFAAELPPPPPLPLPVPPPPPTVVTAPQAPAEETVQVPAFVPAPVEAATQPVASLDARYQPLIPKLLVPGLKDAAMPDADAALSSPIQDRRAAAYISPGLHDDRVTAHFSSLPLAHLGGAELADVLKARKVYKAEVFAEAAGMLEARQEIADLPLCASLEELATDQCAITEALVRTAGQEQQSAVQANVASGHTRIPAIGRKRALVIGINRYADTRIPQLDSAVPDARGIGKLIASSQGYAVTLLENPGKAQIVRSLNRLAREMAPSDSLLVYFAGHGDLVEKTGKSYWVPADARADDPAGWISNADVSRALSLVKARQVVLISDSCYSGVFAHEQLLDVETAAVGRADQYLSKRSVTVMTSGSDEPVADSGKDGHSVFAWNLMQELAQLDSWSPGATVFAGVRTAVERELPQSPQYGASLSAGHEGGGDFLFERRD